MHNGKVGIVSVTYNSAEVLPDFFRSLWQQIHTNFVLYVIDNASKDATVSMLQAEVDCRLRIVASSDNTGVAEGNNIGIRMALADGCDAVLLLNNDVVFPPNLISGLLESLEANRSDMVAPKMMYHEPADKIWWAGGHFQQLFGYRAVHRQIDSIDSGRAAPVQLVSYAPTCCLLLRSQVFSRVGLMDPTYFVYYDDTDFMFRAWKVGVSLLYDPNVKLHHKVNALTGGKKSLFAVRLLARNRVYFWLKHFGRSRTIIYTTALGALYLTNFIFFRKPLSVLSVQLQAFMEGFALVRTQPSKS